MMLSVEPIEQEERRVLSLRFTRAMGREAVARMLGKSAGAVEQVERSALRKLRLLALGPIANGWRDGWDEV